MEVKKRDVARYRLTVRENKDGTSITISFNDNRSKDKLIEDITRYLENESN